MLIIYLRVHGFRVTCGHGDGATNFSVSNTARACRDISFIYLINYNNGTCKSPFFIITSINSSDFR
jgi:hypothetical protein